MSEMRDTRHSVLIVSPTEAFDTAVRKSLRGYLMTESRKNAAAARRCVLERYYDLVVINGPLPDESGEQFALDVTQQCSASVLLAVPSEIYEDVAEHVLGSGVLVVSKPLSVRRLTQCLRFLTAVQNKIHLLESKIEKAQEKAEDLRIVTRAKFLLVERRHMTEDDAHRFIGKQAMDHGISRRRAAEQIIEDYE